MKPLKIFLIRHAQSTLNSGENHEKRIPDHAITLTEDGKKQAHIAARNLAEYLSSNNICVEKARMWVSPYTRTRETANIFNEYLQIPDKKEDIALVEQDFGRFDSVPFEKWKEVDPVAFELYMNRYNAKGKFWARLPDGESPADVALRVRQFFGTIVRDYDHSGIDTLFIVTHGTTLRTFVFNWLHHPYEWFEEEKNPGNCAIRLLDNNKKDCGYIFNGFGREGFNYLTELDKITKKDPLHESHQLKLSIVKDLNGLSFEVNKGIDINIK